MSFSLHRMSRRAICNLQSVFIAFWAGDKLGANEIITEEVWPSDGALDLRLSLLRLGDAKEAAKWKFAVVLPLK
jgi:hypothetical protein